MKSALSLWPPVLQGQPALLAALAGSLELSQYMPPAEMRKKQLGQVAALAEYAAKHSEFFRNKLQEAGLAPEDLATPEGFAKLPLMTRRDIQTAGKSLFCHVLPPQHMPVGEVKTSGSTGEPVRVVKTAVAELFWQAMTLREMRWHQWDFSGRLLAIRANIPKPVTNADWGAPAGLLYDTGESMGIPSFMDIREQLAVIREFRPMVILGYPNNMAGILAQCEKEKTGPLPGLKFFWTYGETLAPQLRGRIENYFGVRVLDNYSSQEMGIIAVQCPVSGLYHVMAENTLVEVLNEKGEPCREGEVGKVVVTDLHNLATPMVRYAIGDYAEVAGACPCGRHLPSLKKIVGRERNLLTKPDGSKNWPFTGFHQYQEIATIFQYQFIQHDVHTIEMRLVVPQPLTPQQEETLRAHVLKSLGHPFTLDFVYFEGSLPRGKNGKFEEFLSLIP